MESNCCIGGSDVHVFGRYIGVACPKCDKPAQWLGYTEAALERVQLIFCVRCGIVRQASGETLTGNDGAECSVWRDTGGGG